MKKNLFCATLFLTAFSAFAGGGNAHWEPKVKPINCVVGLSDSSWGWSQSPSCREVIDKGYAKGVQYRGTFWYNDGSSAKFDVVVTPSQTATFKHPAGKTLKKGGITSWSAEWSK